jgi:sugar/nucleoside kinase (ribokinase family)
MAHLLIIGGASSDILHLSGRTIETAGGAGMYTAMAAKRSGVLVSMFGPRPEPLPENLHLVDGYLTDWFGPVIPIEDLPHFEISYKQGQTEYLDYAIDAESSLSSAMLPDDLSQYDLIHVTPLGDAEKQLEFIRSCRLKGARRVSSGTGLMNTENQPESVRAAFDESDYCFMNHIEASALYGSIASIEINPNQVFYVTLGAEGALVIQGNHVSEVPAVSCQVLDPTGAGDTFCGATGAHLALGSHPIIAAQNATALSAEMITHPGPTALLKNESPPTYPIDDKVTVNGFQVQKVARLISDLPEIAPFDFTGPVLPPAGHSLALDWFFIATLQQFGFWTIDNGKYNQPLIADIAGKHLKGSDFLWNAYLRTLQEDPEFFTSERQAVLSMDEMRSLFLADDGSYPMPALELHLAQARQYGQDMLALELTPQIILDQVQETASPLATFFGFLDKLGGYKEDPLRKKSGLLAFILNQRPEKFLTFERETSPVIDYHAMRACLRIGLVEIQDPELRTKVVERQLIHPSEESAIRYASYMVIDQIASLSGKSMGAVDWFFFNSRKRCPEMTDPECQNCQVDLICAHKKELFQPVLRTAFY